VHGANAASVGRLLVFSNAYPFGIHETFLAGELEALAARFDEVLLTPLWAQPGPARALPANVRLGQPLLESRWPRLHVLWRGALNTAPWPSLAAELARLAKAPALEAAARLGYATLRARALAHNAQLQALLTGNAALAYFYWGVGTADVLAFVRPRMPTVVRFHGSDLYEGAWGGYLPLRDAVVRHVDHALCVSEHGLRHLSNRHPELGTRARLFRLGVSALGRNPEAAGEPLRLLSCAFATPGKRLPLIARALARIDQPTEWTHIGDGPDLAEVRALCKQLPSQVEVRLLGNLSHDQVHDELACRHVDLFLSVSASEGLPVSIMEALSFGVPVIATDVGGCRELVEPRSGVLLPADPSPEQLAQAITAFRARTDHAALRRGAREVWAERVNGQANFAAVADHLRSLAAARVRGDH
jgi:colanic acid/amylovoran biosynthesis glycosyltransferase